MKAMLAAGLACLAVLAAPAACFAQSAADPIQFDPPPSPLACMTVAPEAGTAPVYPRDELKLRSGGMVRVQLQFTTAHSPPAVKVIYNTSGSAFAGAVERYVSHYRLPCLAPQASPVDATQRFDFLPRTHAEPVTYGPVRGVPAPTEEDPGEAAFHKCLVGLSADQIAYPGGGFQPMPKPGNVLLHLVYKDKDAPPDVNVLYDGGSSLLAHTARDAALAQRIPCLPAGASASGTQVFTFRIEGDPVRVFRDTIDLRSLLGFVKDIDKQRAKFDLGSMNCPFQLSFRVLQPYAPNGVGQVGPWDPNRVDLVEWLSGLTLDLPARVRPQAIGQVVTVNVPCGQVDLS